MEAYAIKTKRVLLPLIKYTILFIGSNKKSFTNFDKADVYSYEISS